MTNEELQEEADRATELLAGKKLKRVLRNRKSEVVLEFTDGTRLFVHQTPDGVELSVT